jgi:hypothetical protein
MDMIAKLPTVASIIYRNLYREGTAVQAIDNSKDWSWNFTSMLGFDNPEFVELMRMYLTIHRYSMLMMILSEVRVTRSLVLCVVLCSVTRSLFILLSFFFGYCVVC